MALDPYAICPCGSGKKLKFCCLNVADDLLHMQELLMDNQPKVAEKALEKLYAKDPTNQWTLRLLVQCSQMLRKYPEAERYTAELLEHHPESPFGAYFDALQKIVQPKLPVALEAINSATAKLFPGAPGLMQPFVQRIAEVFEFHHVPLAERRYRYLVPAFARSAEERENALQACREFDSEQSIPYPFRSDYKLWELPEGQPHAEEFQAAMALANGLQFLSAARKFESLADLDEHQPVFSRNAGLCYAWAGDAAAGAELLGQAADDTPDFEAGVEMEVLAQLLDFLIPEDAFELARYRYPVKSVSKLLTLLDQHPRLVRLPIPEEVRSGRQPVALYYLLDHPVPADSESLTITNLPQVLASLAVLPESPESSMTADLVVTTDSEQFQPNDLQGLLGAIEEELQATSGEGIGRHPNAQRLPREYAWLAWRWYFPVDRQHNLREESRLVQQHWQSLVNQVWWNRPLAALDGLTPGQAAGNPDWRLPLTAAVTTLEALTGAHQYYLEADELRQRLQLPPREPLVTTNRDLSVQEIGRLEFDKIPVEQLKSATLMLMISQPHHILKRCLETTLQRTDAHSEIPPAVCHELLANLAAQRSDTEGALQHLRDWESQLQADGKLTLEARITIHLREFSLRMEAPDAPETVELLQRIVREYYPKVPEIKQNILQLLDGLHIDNPQLRTIAQGYGVVMAGAGAGSGGLWTPGQDGGADAAAAGGGLWLPGQG